MTDQSKRRTLKIISGLGTAAASSLAMRNSFAEPTISATPNETLKPVALTDSQSSSTLPYSCEIQIITGRSALEDTVIFSNNTNENIVITEFLPGLITQNNQMIDLNSLVQSTEIKLAPGYPLATKAARWELLSLNSNHSYLWCDTAVSMLPDSDTGIITIHAVVNNGRALLTAQHDEAIFS